MSTATVDKVYSPRVTEIETAGGNWVNFKDPSQSNITIDDIAHGAGAMCRYTGHVRRGVYEDGTPIPVHYSVAEHAVLVSKKLEEDGAPWEIQFAGLHHDSAESFLGDVSRPLKTMVAALYRPLEDIMDEAIAHALRAPWLVDAFHDTRVKQADNWALLTEAYELLPSRGAGWGGSSINWGLDMEAANAERELPEYWYGTRGNKIELVGRTAKTLFLNRHWELMNR